MNAVMNEPPKKKRFKWEPVAALVLVILLGLWLALGPNAFQKLPTREGAVLNNVRIADTRGLLETTRDAQGVPHYRLLTRDGHTSRDMSETDVRELFGDRVLAQANADRPNLVFRLLNITTWVNLVWIGVGLIGQLAFSSRFLVQWLVSEKQRKTVVPESFWWMSLLGGLALFAYFVWRQDPIGVLGQSSGLVIYSRNLRLIHKQKRREARAAASAAAVPTSESSASREFQQAPT
jgi:lipid-A-disaccharide synthase-like uncharacterized protein